MISAREVEEAQFRPAGLGQAGYDEAAVDGFLDRAVKTLQAIEAGDALPMNAITSSDVVEATFPERPADSAAGYNLDDVDDLLDAVALRLFKSERNRGQARQQLAARDSQNVADSENVLTQDVGQVGYTEAAAPELNDEPHRVDADGQDVALRDEREESAARSSDRISVDAANVNADVASEPVAGGAAPENKREDAVLPGQTMLNIGDSQGTSQLQTHNGEQPVWNGWEDPSAPAAPSAPAVQTPQDDAPKGSSAYAAPAQTQPVWNGWEDPSAPAVNDADEALSSQDDVSDPSDAVATEDAKAASDSMANPAMTDDISQQGSDAPQSSVANDDSNDSRVADVVGAAGLGVAGVAAGHAVAERHERAEIQDDERVVPASSAVTSTPATLRSNDSDANDDANAVSSSPRASAEPASSAANTSAQVSGINLVGGDPVAEERVENASTARVTSGPINPVGADVESESAQVTRSASTQSDSLDNNSAEPVAREDSADASTSADVRPVADGDVRKDDASRSSNHAVEAVVAGGATAGVAGLAHHESAKKDAGAHETVSEFEANRAPSAMDNAERVVSTDTVADARNADAATVQTPSTQATSLTPRDGENSASARNDEFAGINPVGGEPLEDSVARGHSAPVSAGTQPAGSAQSATNHHVGMAAVGAVGGAAAGAAVSSHESTNAVSRDEAQVPTQPATDAVADRPVTNDAVREATPVSANVQNDSDAASTSDVKTAGSPVTDDVVREQSTPSAENEPAAKVPVTEEVSKAPAPLAASAQVDDAPGKEREAQSSDEISLEVKTDDAPARRRYRTEAAAGVVGLGAAGALYEHERSEKQDSEPRESAPASDVAASSSNKANVDAPHEEFTADEPAQVVQETSSESAMPDAGSATTTPDDRVVYVNRDGFGEERTVNTNQSADTSQVTPQSTDAQADESLFESQNGFVSNGEAPASSASASSDDTVTPAEVASVEESATPEDNESAAAPVAEDFPATEEVSETNIVTDAPGTPGEVGWIAPTAADHYGVREDDRTSDDTTDAASAQSVPSPTSNSADDFAVQDEAKQNDAAQNRSKESSAQQNANQSATDTQSASTKGDELAAAAAGTAVVGAAGVAVAVHEKSGDSATEQQKSAAAGQADDVQTSAATPGSEFADAAALSNPEQAPAPVVMGKSDDSGALSQPQDDASAHTASSAQGEAEAKTPTSVPGESQVASTPTSSQPVPSQPVTTAVQGQTPVPTNPGSEDEVNFHPEYSEYVPGAVTPTSANNTASANDTTTSNAGSDAGDNAAAGQQPAQASSAPYVKRPAASTQPEIDRGPDAGVLPLSLTNEENTVSNSEQASSVGRPEPIDAPSSIDGPEQVKQATSVPKREENEGALGFVRRLLKRS